MPRSYAAPFALGTVVRFARKGARRRYVVASLDQFGGHTVAALSGAWRGSNSSGVDPCDLVADPDQRVSFEGKLADKLRHNVAFALQLHKHAAPRDTHGVVAAWERGERPALSVQDGYRPAVPTKHPADPQRSPGPRPPSSRRALVAANSNVSRTPSSHTKGPDMPKQPRKDAMTLGAADRANLEQWINSEYHHRWTTRADRELVEKLVTSRLLTKTDVRKAVAAMRRARQEGNRRIREYGSIPRDNVALARLDEEIDEVAFYLR